VRLVEGKITLFGYVTLRCVRLLGGDKGKEIRMVLEPSVRPRQKMDDNIK
jgi:hypothetical protein